MAAGQPLVVIAKFYVSSDQDPEEVAQAFNDGLGVFGPIMDATRNFPAGEVFGAEVDQIRPADEHEVSNWFEEEG